MGDELHKLLARQLRRTGIDPQVPPSPAAWAELLARVSRTYTDADNDRYLLERAFDQTSSDMQALHARLADDHDRLQREMLIAQVAQTSLLPLEHAGAHLDVAATLVPATEVGGDYYDMINLGDTSWLAIGDVAGHGLRTALIMLMAQSIVAAIVRATPALEPSEVLAVVNRALWDNIRQRLASDEHMTCTLLRCDPGGRVRYAGAHEELVVCRAATGECETFMTPGTWLGVIGDVAGKNPDRELQLAPGDVLVLYTDGITEARDADKRQFGMERLIAAVARHRTEPLPALRDAIFAEVEHFRAVQEDDATIVVAAYR